MYLYFSIIILFILIQCRKAQIIWFRYPAHFMQTPPNPQYFLHWSSRKWLLRVFFHPCQFFFVFFLLFFFFFCIDYWSITNDHLFHGLRIVGAGADDRWHCGGCHDIWPGGGGGGDGVCPGRVRGGLAAAVQPQGGKVGLGSVSRTTERDSKILLKLERVPVMLLMCWWRIWSRPFLIEKGVWV